MTLSCGQFRLLTPYDLIFWIHVGGAQYELNYYYRRFEQYAEVRLQKAIENLPLEVSTEILKNKKSVLAEIKKFLDTPETQKRYTELNREEDERIEKNRRENRVKTRKRKLKQLSKLADELFSLGSSLDEMTTVLKESLVKHVSNG